MEKIPCVYIVASGRNGTIYTGVTSHLQGRIYQHREKVVEGFTERYDVNRLVWFEVHPTMESAILREKRIKAWKRDWKLALIEEENPTWRDLAEDLGFDPFHNYRLITTVNRHSSESWNPELSSGALTSPDSGLRRNDNY